MIKIDVSWIHRINHLSLAATLNKPPARTGSDMTDDLCLVLDIGGTNTRVALTRGHALMAESVKKYPNSDFRDLKSVIDTYLDDQNPGTLDRVCVAAAGPVSGDRAEMTNLDWVIDALDIGSATGSTKVGVINDLQAQGYSLHMLDKNDTRCVLAGTHQVHDNDTKIVIGMGTGFNAAPVFHTSAGRYVPPSEIGHARIAVASAEQAKIVSHIQSTEGFTSNEHVLAGRGLERLDHAINQRQDRRAADIMDAARTGDKTAVEVAKMQAQFAGSVYGDMALANLPLGGLYLIGGVARALEPYLSSDVFSQSFRDKGRFGPFNEQFSVHLVLDDFAALKGCASYIMSRMF